MKKIDDLTEEEIEHLYRRVCKEHAGKDLLCSKIGVVRQYFREAVPPEELSGLKALSAEKEAGSQED